MNSKKCRCMYSTARTHTHSGKCVSETRNQSYHYVNGPTHKTIKKKKCNKLTGAKLWIFLVQSFAIVRLHFCCTRRKWKTQNFNEKEMFTLFEKVANKKQIFLSLPLPFYMSLLIFITIREHWLEFNTHKKWENKKKVVFFFACENIFRVPN